MQIVDVTELGRRVRALRLQRGMTLKQVESLCGLSATHLSEVERGRTSPTLGALTRLAGALGRETAYFLEPEELPEVAVHRGEDARPEPLGQSLSRASLTAVRSSTWPSSVTNALNPVGEACTTHRPFSTARSRLEATCWVCRMVPV